MEDKTTLDAIHRIMPELRESKEKLKTMREQLKDVMEQNDEMCIRDSKNTWL